MDTLTSQVAAFGGSVIFLLLGGNIFFVKRLVDRIENSATQVLELGQKVHGMAVQLTEIKTDIKDYRRIEIEVAVLKAQFNPGAKAPI